MITKLKIPKPDANIEQASIGTWLKKEGDPVSKGEAVVEIITDKSTFELQSPRAGTLLRVLAPEKSTVPVGFVVALLGKPDDPLPDTDKENERLVAAWEKGGGRAPGPSSSGAEKRASGGAAAGDAASGKEALPQPGHVRSTPAARRMAKEHGIVLGEAAAFADGGVVNELAVRRFLESGK